MSTTLIITGGNIDIEWADEWLSHNKFDYCIAADSGLSYADKLGVHVDYLLGDYDSIDKLTLDKYKENVDFKVYPREKDYTDTHLAIITAINNGADDIYIIGATGTRMDHTLTNIGNMKAALDCDVKCHIVDKYNNIYMLNNKNGIHTIRKDEQYGNYVSIFPMSEEVVITLEGFKYKLDKYILKQGLSICQSNEIEENNAKITIHKGLAVIFETRD